MTHRITLTVTAVKERERLDETARERIDRAVRSLGETPRPPGVKKLAGSQRDWRIRVGDYRVLYEIDDQQEVITIWRIAHRRQAYR
ncbi:MAG: translation repressor RelE [Chloroflexota bacterium]|nr:type II toxin-antitoxin system RelE/ParE family toxin [Ardenticatenaceae bacterium]GIK55168.1 MAG: translation repressor RelE [Chloroflexota bacterium]